MHSAPHRLQFADATEQHAHKQTVRVNPSIQKQVVQTIQDTLPRHGVKPFIISGPTCHEGWGFIDVLPARAGKGSALEHVRQQHLDMPGEFCVAAGDSPNDLQMLGDHRWHVSEPGP